VPGRWPALVEKDITESRDAPPPVFDTIREAMNFEIVGEIQEIEIIATGKSIRERARLNKVYGIGRWRKLKGIARIRLQSGRIRLTELHWYEAHGIGKRDIKRKRYLD
jgi:hypothetical protein